MDKKLAKSGLMNNNLINKAKRHHDSGQLFLAEKIYKTILDNSPNDPDALHLLGVLRAQLNDPQTGANLINKALSIKPKFPAALSNLGKIYFNAGNFHMAQLAYTRSVRLEPNLEKTWNSLAVTFLNAKNYDAAIASLSEGLRKFPFSEALYDNLCQILKRQKKFSECLELIEKALEKIPESDRLWIHKANCSFVLGRFKEGWEAYSWRFATEKNPNKRPDYPIKEWSGENLKSKKILIWTEQGPGETFLYAPLINEINAMCQECLIISTKRLVPILKRSFPNTQIADENQIKVTEDSADFQTSLIEIAKFLRKNWQDFKSHTPVIKSNPVRTIEYRKLLKKTSNNNLLVGISWKSIGVNFSDKKSIPLEFLKPILATPSITFVNLQYGDSIDEIKNHELDKNFNIITKPEIDPIENLDEYLSLIAAMDLVVSSSSTAAHAAASQGIPTFCILPHTLGEGLLWHWFTDREDSPWYNSLRIFRQIEHNDWSNPIAQTAIELSKWAQKKQKEIKLEKHYLALSHAFLNNGNIDSAQIAAKASINEGVNDISAYRIIAKYELGIKKPENAVKYISKGMEHQSESIDLIVDLAISMSALEDFEEAIKLLNKALEINPSHFEATLNLAINKRRIGETEQAKEIFEKSLRLNPQAEEIKLSIATCCFELGKTNEAESIFKSLIEEGNEIHAASSTMGMALLIDGRLKEGWHLIKHRLALPNANIRYDNFSSKIWNGEKLSNKNLLVWTEQGIGEEIIISTMLNDLYAISKSIVLLCSKRMLPIFKSSFKKITVLERIEPLPSEAVAPKIDFQMSLSDIGLATRPSLDSFNKTLKPVLIAQKKLTKKLKQKYIDVSGSYPLVGISWSSTAPELGKLKSIEVRLIGKIIKLSNACFVSLQHKPLKNDIEFLAKIDKSRWIYDNSIDPLNSIEDAAAQIAALDHVVTTSNTTAHLAGALGVNTSLLLPTGTGRHWYWFRNQKKSSWYPSVDIYEYNKKENLNDIFKTISGHINSLDKK